MFLRTTHRQEEYFRLVVRQVGMAYTVGGGLMDYDVGCLTLCGIIVIWNLSACNGAAG